MISVIIPAYNEEKALLLDEHVVTDARKFVTPMQPVILGFLGTANRISRPAGSL